MSTGYVGPATLGDGAIAPIRQGKGGEAVVTQLHGRYYESCYRRKIFMAHAIVTAPVIYTTAAGTGGPLLWNGGTSVNAVILGVGFGVSVVSTVAAAVGLTGGGGQSAAPTTTTAIDSNKSTFVGGGDLPVCTTYRIGTPAAAGTFFFPFADVHTGALTVDNAGMKWTDLGGAFVVPPGSWISVAASATATTLVASIGLIWEEVPV